VARSATSGAKLVHGRRPPGIFFSCLIGLASACLTSCYRPQVILGPEPPAVTAEVLQGMQVGVPGLRLHVFNTGMNRVSPLLVGSPAPWRPVPAFVLEHLRQGLIVFDCGLGPEIARRREGALHPLTRLLFKTRSRPGLDLASQMRGAGLDPEKVTTVIFSHLHFDHVGAAEAFRHATFVVGRGEREGARSRMNGFAPRHTDWIAPSAWREIDFRHAASYATFDHAVDLFGDHSVMLVAGGGHTRGGLGALVTLPQGPVLLAGDLVVHFAWLASDDVERIVVDAPRAADVRNRIRALMKQLPALVLFPGHDLSRAPGDRSDIVLHRRFHGQDLFSTSAWPTD